MNEDSSTYDLPDYIHSRLQPQILIDFPDRIEELAILRENLPFAEDHILNYVTDFLQRSHQAEERFTVRDGINAARYAMKLKSQNGLDDPAALLKAFSDTLGDDAMPYVPKV
jgi:hypothetical protein